MSDATADQTALLSTTHARAEDRHGALAVALASSVIFVAIIPYVRIPLARVDAFIPAYQAALVVSDLVTAVLLLGQFSIVRQRAMLVLAAGYLFTAAMAVVHALTFPGLFSGTGLLGATPDSTAWIYMFWHGGFPLVVIGYALMKGKDRAVHAGEASPRRMRSEALAAAVAALIAAGGVTVLTTAGGHLLPPIMDGIRSGPLMPYVINPIWALPGIALVVLAARRPHSVLDVWLMVVMLAWVFEIALSAVFNGGRFTLGYYAGRLYGLLAANFVLIVILFEINRLYARLARSFKTVSANLSERTASLTDTAHKLHNVHATLEAALKASPPAIVALDAEQNVMLWNEAAERLLGWTGEDVVGKAYPAIPPSEREKFEADFARAMSGEEIVGARVTRGTKDGRRVELSVNSAPMRNEDGYQTGVFYVITDLTNQLAMERQLHQAQKMEMVGQLTGGIAHDFNNLLAVAIGNLDLIAEAVEDDSNIRELLQAALDSCLRGAELTRQLLAFSRRQPLRPEAIDPAAALRNLMQMLGRTLGEQITLQLDAEEGLWPVVADRTQLGTAILNLAVNARDAMPDGGILSIELINVHFDESVAEPASDVTPGKYVEIAVTDTGSGMPPEIVARAIDPFFTTKGAGRGTGLGLSMVYGFIKQSGGHFKIYSEPGNGTTIKLWLPRADPDGAVDAGPERRPTIETRRGKETILVVEDNVDIRKVALQQLKDLGYRAIAAADASSAFELLKDGAKVDLLFTDIIMPGGMDGRALAREATALWPDLKVLFTSGFTQTGVARNSAEALPAPLLSKPYRKWELAARLREALDQ